MFGRDEIDDTTVAAPPTHVAIIMDGNGRWASKRLMPRFEGHRRGVEALRRTVRAAAEGTIRKPGDLSQAATTVHLAEPNPRYCSSREGPRVRCCLVPNRW